MQALGDDDDALGNHSTSGCNPPIVEDDDDDLDFENWDGDDDTGGRESSSDDSGYEVNDFLSPVEQQRIPTVLSFHQCSIAL